MFDFPRSIPKRLSLLVLAAAFLAAGVNHFLNPSFYVSIMPPYLPAHLELVYISGAFEILGAIGVMLGPMRSWAGYGLIALLAAVFPANIHMAMNPEAYVADGAPLWLLYARLPLQLVFAAWVYWSVLTSQRGSRGSSNV